MTTYQDCIAHLMDYLGSAAGAEQVRDAKRAVLEAYRDIANAHRWSYLYTHGRIITIAPVTDGTITYTHTGGTYERMVTLAGATWPTWAAGAYIRLGDYAVKVVERKSATVVTLDEQINPGVDLPALTTYSLYQDTYLLPVDFTAQDQALYEGSFAGLSYVHPREWLYDTRYILSEGQPREYTITGDALHPQRLVLRLAPAPVEVKTVDFLYHRRPRALTIAEERRGAVAITSGSNVVTGTSTFFTANMVGSVFRVSGTAAYPTSPVDDNPAAFESIIQAVASGTSIVLEEDAPAAFSGSKFTVSDPIDIEPGAMLNAYFRRCEACICQNRTLKDKPSANAQWLKAIEDARSADSRSFMGRSAGERLFVRPRLRDMPSVPETE